MKSTRGNSADLMNAEVGIRKLLHAIGEDLTREGLHDTPARVVKAFMQQTEGYTQDPATVLATVFEEKFDEMIVLRNIEFNSLCEHHLLPFVGTVTIGYVSDGYVVGISKLARLVDCFAKRLQIQERMTTQIAEAIETHLKAKGVGVVVKAAHQCMTCRGVMKHGAEMVTSEMRGVMLTKPEARAEFMRL